MFDNRGATVDMEKVYHELENEMHSLQVVEYIFENIEKNKQASSVKFNSVPLKKDLYRLLQLLRSERGEIETSGLEFELHEGVERWILLLAQRDKSISISELRSYCEHSKPPISPQALLSLIKFYIGLPFSETVRAKLDMLVTRLFSHKIWNGTRQLTASKDEIRDNFEELYKNWANVPSFSQFSDREISFVLNRFREFSEKAQQMKSLDELLGSNFHNEFLAFKSKLNENFFEPSILASAIEANVLIGNRYVELLLEEKEKLGEEVLSSKYAFLETEVISTAIGKTFSPLEIIGADVEMPTEAPLAQEEIEEEPEEVKKETVKSKKVKLEKPRKSRLSFELSFEVRNKWLIALLLLTVALGVSLYIYVEFSRSGVTNANVEVLDVENSEFRGYLKVAKIGNEVMFGVVTDSWKTLSENEKRAIIERMLSVGKQRRFNKVYLLNNNGLAVASASEGNIEIFDR